MRRLSSGAFLLGTAIVGTLSCQESRDPENQFFPGLATFGHEVRSFRPCGSEESLWAIDSSGVLWDLHHEFAPGAEPYEEVFAAVRGYLGPPLAEGFGADYEGTLVVEEVLYAAGEGFGCETDWRKFSYRASGNEPFWSLDITPEAIELNQLGLGKKSWTLTSEEHTGDVVHFTGRAPDATTMEVKLRPKRHVGTPCQERFSGSRRPFGSKG